MKLLKILGFRHKVVNFETGELISVTKDSPQILTASSGFSYMVAIVQKYDQNNNIIYGGIPRRLYIFENQHPEIFHALEEGKDILIPGDIVPIQVTPYVINNQIYRTKTIAFIANNELECELAIEKAIKYQEERL